MIISKLEPRAGGGSRWRRSSKTRSSNPIWVDRNSRIGDKIGGGFSGSGGISCRERSGRIGVLGGAGSSTWRYQGIDVLDSIGSDCEIVERASESSGVEGDGDCFNALKALNCRARFTCNRTGGGWRLAAVGDEMPASDVKASSIDVRQLAHLVSERCILA